MSGRRPAGARTTAPDAQRVGRIALVGAGRAGLTVATALARGGSRHITSVCRGATRQREVAHWIARGRIMGALPDAEQCAWQVLPGPDPTCARADTVVFATADRDLAVAARQWQQAGASRSGQVWLHLSGVLPPEVLAVDAGSDDLGSMHPLAAIPDPLKLPDPSPGMPPVDAAIAPLQGALFALAGTEVAMGRAQALALRLGGRAVPVAQDARDAWHAAAAIVANDLVGLLITGEALATAAGVEGLVARRGLLHLARTALDALEPTASRPGVSLVDGLTGAVGRGDADTLAAHMRALKELPDGWAAHTALSRILLHAVCDAGLLSDQAAGAVEQTLARRAPRRSR